MSFRDDVGVVQRTGRSLTHPLSETPPMRECAGSTDNGLRRDATPCMNKAGADGFCHVHRPANAEARQVKKATRAEEARRSRSEEVARICDRLKPDLRSSMRSKVHLLVSLAGERAVHDLLDAFDSATLPTPRPSAAPSSEETDE